MTKPYRTEFIDYDARREPKTNRYCVMCQRDIKPGAKAREVHCVDGGAFALHPDDEHLYPSGDPGDCGMQLLGLDCARKLGLEWSRPEAPTNPAEPDAECTECGDMYFSGDGPHFNIAVCAKCFASGSTGPLGVVS